MDPKPPPTEHAGSPPAEKAEKPAPDSHPSITHAAVFSLDEKRRESNHRSEP